MKSWEPKPPPGSELGDHDVRLFGQHLAEKRVALMVSGGIGELDGAIVGFSMARQPERDIFALFVLSQFEGRGIGTSLLAAAVQAFPTSPSWGGHISGHGLAVPAGGQRPSLPTTGQRRRH